MGGVLCLGWEQTKGVPPQATLWGHIADFHSAMNPHHTNCHRRTALAPSNQHSGRRSGCCFLAVNKPKAFQRLAEKGEPTSQRSHS